MKPRRVRRQKAFAAKANIFQQQCAADAALISEQREKACDVAEVLIKATSVFGSTADAAIWLGEPALALDGRRPVDLVATRPGHDLVMDLLVRLEYGVYA